MFEELFGSLEETFTSIVESEVFQVVIYVVVAYIVLIWLSSSYWAYRDMRLRTASAITPYVAALAIILFTPVFFLFGLLLYRIVRPKETIAEVNERALAEEAMLAEVASHAHCANCDRPVHEEWIICPTCRNRLRRVCPNCEHLIELDWTLCAWCGRDFERADAPGTTAFMPTARPAVMGQQPAPRMPAPPPPAPVRQVPPFAPPAAAEQSTPAAASNPRPPTQPQGAPAPAPRSAGISSARPVPSGSGSGAAPGGANAGSHQPAGGAQASSGTQAPTGI